MMNIKYLMQLEFFREREKIPISPANEKFFLELENNCKMIFTKGYFYKYVLH